MISLEDALAAYSKNLRALPAETVPLTQALNRVLVQAQTSNTDLPRFDQSAMDGYAFRAADLAAASVAAPLRLPISAKLPAGSHENLQPLQGGSAARILTGAPLPPGADTVIPQERVTRQGDALVFTEPYPANKNIRWRGEELKQGAPIAAPGHRVTPGLLAALVNAGVEQVEVYRFPWLAAALIPALAIFFQAFFPVQFPFLRIFDVPLLVTIFLGVTRRNPVTGLVTGCVIGLIQDSLTHHPLGVYGIAKTVVGFGASSLGVKLDVENAVSRFLVTYGFYLLHQFLYFSVQRGLVGEALGWAWGHELLAALVNAAAAVALFAVLDRFKQRN